jgi:folate-dependent tRNA-U54 methylase TrmFO/GidA
MNANFGLVEALDTEVRDKRRKKELLAERSLADLAAWRAVAATPLSAVSAVAP